MNGYKASDFVTIKFWVGDWGEYAIDQRWDGVIMRKDNYPDKRYKSGREMIKHFKRVDMLNVPVLGG